MNTAMGMWYPTQPIIWSAAGYSKPVELGWLSMDSRCRFSFVMLTDCELHCASQHIWSSKDSILQFLRLVWSDLIGTVHQSVPYLARSRHTWCSGFGTRISCSECDGHLFHLCVCSAWSASFDICSHALRCSVWLEACAAQCSAVSGSTSAHWDTWRYVLRVFCWGEVSHEEMSCRNNIQLRQMWNTLKDSWYFF